MRSEKGLLFVFGWHVKFGEKSEYVLWVVEDVVRGTDLVKEGHEARMIGTGNLVLIAIGADVSFLHAGKKAVELGVEILPVALTQGHTNAEADDAADLSGDAGV